METISKVAIQRDRFTALINEGAFGVPYVIGTAFGCECGWEGVGESRHHMGCNYIFLDGHAKIIRGNGERIPQIPCPGAFKVLDCVCAAYTTYDF